MKQGILAFSLAIAAICGLHAATLTTSPGLWQDEVQDLDFGRSTLFEPETDWSLLWSGDAHRTIYSPYYLGCWLEEAAFRLTLPSAWGPRAMAVLGAVLATIALVGWLSASGVPPVATFPMGLAFFLEPHLIAAYRGDRPDCWAIACCCAACWLLRSAAIRSADGRSFLPMVALAGILTPTAAFFWPTSFLIYPLLLIEALPLAGGLLRGHGPRRLLGAVGVYIGFALLAAAALLGPLWEVLPEIGGDFRELLGSSRVGAPKRFDRVEAVRTLMLSPFLPAFAVAAAVAGLARRRDMLLSAATLGLLGFTLTTRYYGNRLIYLYPYIFALLSRLVADLGKGGVGARRWAARLVVAVLVAWSCGLFAARTAISLMERRQRDPSALIDLGRRAIGPGPHTVYLGAWEFYNTGRLLGWRMFRLFIDEGTLRTDMEALDRIDREVGLRYVLMRGSEVDRATEEALGARGFARAWEYKADQGSSRSLNTFAKTFTSYVVYEKGRAGPAPSGRPRPGATGPDPEAAP